MAADRPDPVDSYFAAIRALLNSIDLAQIRAAGSLVAAALESGGVVHTFGSGHSWLLAQELFYRAGGLVAVTTFLDDRLGFARGALEGTEFERRADAADELAAAAEFVAGDLGIVISNSGRNALPIEMALRMKAANMKVIALTSIAHSTSATSRHPSGSRLFEIADLVLDNHCPPGDAVIQIAGVPAAMGPLSTIAGAAVLHATMIEAARQLTARGKPPSVFVSANVGEATETNLRLQIAPYAPRIRYYRTDGR
jgi:uncharacterized phosphosugar-binding protein